MKLVVLAGLPGTGKSTLARALAPRLHAVVLNKDQFRRALFGELVDGSRDQDDAACRAMYAAVEALAAAEMGPVILDGRTYSKSYQVHELSDLAERVRADLTVVECVCSDDVARARLTEDARERRHPAPNRAPELYEELRRAADPIQLPKLVLGTSTGTPDELASVVVDRLRPGA